MRYRYDSHREKNLPAAYNVSEDRYCQKKLTRFLFDCSVIPTLL